MMYVNGPFGKKRVAPSKLNLEIHGCSKLDWSPGDHKLIHFSELSKCISLSSVFWEHHGGIIPLVAIGYSQCGGLRARHRTSVRIHPVPRAMPDNVCKRCKRFFVSPAGDLELRADALQRIRDFLSSNIERTLCRKRARRDDPVA